MVLLINSVLYSSATDKFWYLSEDREKKQPRFSGGIPGVIHENTRPEVKLSQAENDILKNIMLSLGGKMRKNFN